ncbi:MAG: MmcQ/YjbR family DNA-binding protein [Candidatus Saccharimonadales bacterium]
MLTYAEFETFITGLDDSIWLDFPFDEKTAVFKFGEKPEGKIVALVELESKPLRVSLKCDPQLAEHLRSEYETVLPGYHLNKRHWNTILCTGQLDTQEVLDLARLSYELVRR